MNKYITGVVILLVLFNGITACKIGKRIPKKHLIVDTTTVSQPKIDTTTQAVKPPVINDEKKQLIISLTPLLQQQINYTTFNGKAKMRYEGPDMKQEFTANFRIRKDSVIWVAVTALGGLVQVARIEITPDSFVLINYLQKEVTSMPLTQAAKLLPVPVDFSLLQNFIVGNALHVSGQITDATDFGGTWSIQAEDSNYIQQITYNKADSTMRTSQLRTHNENGLQAMIQYGNYVIVESQKVSSDRAINIQNNGQQYYLDMSFSNFGINQPLDYPFTIPKNYTIK